MGWGWKDLNPVHFIEDHIVEPLNKALGWNEPGDGAGINIDANYSTALNEEQIENYNQTMNYTNEIENNNTEYLNQQWENQKMTSTATTEEQNWLQRNQDWIIPLATTAMQMGYNYYQQQNQNDYNANQAQINRDYNSAEAEKNRQWQENMSNTAITRQVSDLTNAGINPILASQLGGSAVTAGSQASGTPATSAGLMGMNMKDMMSTALTHNQIANLEADTALKNKQSGKTDAETKYTENKTALETALNEVQQELIKAQTKDAKQAAQQKQQMIINQMIQNLYEFQTGRKMPNDMLSHIVGQITYMAGRDKTTLNSADTLYQIIKAEINKYEKGNHK